MSKPIVLIAEELSPATIDALGPDFEVRHVDGASREALLPALADVDAVLIRSATKMDTEAIAAAKNLKVIARAGVGLDNVDVPAATRAGVMVVNAPTSNITSAAELAVGLLLSTARNIAPANQALKGGAWKRSKYGGVELLDKKVGVVGFGRIGQLVAERLKGFGMEILAYDPYVSAQRAGQLGAQLVTLDELLEQSDFITVHLPKNPETVGLIGKEALTKVKPSVRIINAARGGIVDEEALAEALREGRVAGAGIDVFATEPTTESPLFEHESVVVTPHLGASTDEAQEKAGVSVAKSVRLALGGDLVPDAVNVSSGVVPEEVRPGIALVEKLGRIFTSLAGSVPVQLDVDVQGEITAHDVSIWKLAALKGLFTDVTEDPVTYVNAPLLAEQRGCEVRLLTDPTMQDFRNVTTLRGTLADGSTISVAGTLTGPRLIEKVVGVNGFDIEVPLTEHLAFFTYVDRPGVIGTVGRLLGDADINIAGMQVARNEKGGQALVALTVDSRIPADVLAAIVTEVGADVSVVDLAD
ncbi:MULTISPECIES: phosphoglycerate dehydrogenase [unclassified Phycicoccus]|uniref:phosphoglycerate dehydrogenase n=1 Tax=unclassified Phycicoccus TaxID=2637926 RepID=UPI0007031BA5|nr:MULTISPECIES: phosphoglycerate dehydrogenase [unclassified Phycicoccus]KRF25586.1 3-phosphoglycerate dehydrogenase [Phycicoccus sp. Soil803]KRF27800.1 3-phosphoglycerate dehydrogenase [Phycicoccus sp. Soil802]